MSSRLVIFEVSRRLLALPLEAVGRIVLVAELTRPPGLPSSVEGFLNLAGTLVPVLRLDRLYRLPEMELGLYSHILLLRGPATGLLVERVRDIPRRLFQKTDLGEGFTPNDAAVGVGEGFLTVLSPERILLDAERARLEELAREVERRLKEAGPA